MARLRKIFGIAFGVLIQLVASVGSSYGVCCAGQVLHELKNSEGLYEERWCVIGKCRPGSQPVICDRDGSRAGCMECANGWYQDAEIFTNSSKTCYPHTPCSYEKGLKLFIPGNLTADNVCICDSSRGLQPKNKGFINQKSCGCLSGFQWDDELFWCKEDPGSHKSINNTTLVANSGPEPPTAHEVQMKSPEGHNISVFLVVPIAVVLVLLLVITVSVLINRRNRSQHGHIGSERLQNENSSGTNSGASETSSLIQVESDENVKTETVKPDETIKAVQCTEDCYDMERETERLKSIEQDMDPAALYNSNTGTNSTAESVQYEVLRTDQVSSQHNDSHTECPPSTDQSSINQTLHVPEGPGNTTIIVAGNNSRVKIFQNNPSS